MKRIGKLTLAAMAVLALSTIAFADGAQYSCTGADTPGLQDAINALAAGDSLTVDGNCVTTEALLLNLGDFTLMGPKPPKQAKCATSDSLGASITNVGCGPVIELLQGSSGTTIAGLALNNANAEGTSHVIGNGPFARVGCTGGPPDLPGPFHQPDDITIRGNVLVSDTGRCVSQYNHNGPPLNDTHACEAVGFIDTSCAGPLGGPVGIPTGWVIEDNTCTTQTNTGIMITGNDNRVVGNCITSNDEGIRVQNNACSSVPSVITFGAAPAASNNLIEGNTVEVALDPSGTFYALMYIGLGYDYFTTIPELDTCQRNFGTRILGNCATISDPYDVFGFVTGMQYQLENFLVARENDLTLLPPASALGNAGVVNYDTNHSTWESNRFTGADDYGLLSLNGTEVGNTFAGNQLGQGDMGIPFYAIMDFGLGPNAYLNNQYCDGDVLVATVISSVVHNNQAGHFCDFGPAKSCLGSSEGSGLWAGSSLAGRRAGAVPMRDRATARPLLDYDDQLTPGQRLPGDNLTSSANRARGRSVR